MPIAEDVGARRGLWAEWWRGEDCLGSTGGWQRAEHRSAAGRPCQRCRAGVGPVAVQGRADRRKIQAVPW